MIAARARRDADRAHAEYDELARRHHAGEDLTVDEYVTLFGPWYATQLEPTRSPKETPCA